MTCPSSTCYLVFCNPESSQDKFVNMQREKTDKIEKEIFVPKFVLSHAKP